MNQKEFKKLIESIGFKLNDRFSYEYKEFRIYLYDNFYNFWNCSEIIYDIPLNDLTEILKLSRSIKFKELLR